MAGNSQASSKSALSLSGGRRINMPIMIIIIFMRVESEL